MGPPRFRDKKLRWSNRCRFTADCAKGHGWILRHAPPHLQPLSLMQVCAVGPDKGCGKGYINPHVGNIQLSKSTPVTMAPRKSALAVLPFPGLLGTSPHPKDPPSQDCILTNPPLPILLRVVPDSAGPACASLHRTNRPSQSYTRQETRLRNCFPTVDTTGTPCQRAWPPEIRSL